MQNQVRLTHGRPHSESVQFITSAQPFWAIIRTGDQSRDRLKAEEMIAYGFCPLYFQKHVRILYPDLEDSTSSSAQVPKLRH